jgi:hypothetical protein
MLHSRKLLAHVLCLGYVRSPLRLKILVYIVSLKSFATDPLGVAVARFACLGFVRSSPRLKTLGAYFLRSRLQLIL